MKNSHSANTEILTAVEAAQVLGVTEGFLRNDRHSKGRIPFLKLGHRTVRYRRSDLERYLSASVCSSTSEYTQRQQVALT